VGQRSGWSASAFEESNPLLIDCDYSQELSWNPDPNLLMEATATVEGFDHASSLPVISSLSIKP
jgi:hypothetical protein